MEKKTKYLNKKLDFIDSYTLKDYNLALVHVYQTNVGYIIPSVTEYKQV